MTTRIPRSDYTAADFLTYLHRQDALGFLSDQLDLIVTDADTEDAQLDLPDVITMLCKIRSDIADAYRLTCPHTTTYSNGVPVNRVELYPHTEPGEDGEDVPVVGELHYTIHPNGTPEQPENPGGKWADAVAARLFGSAA